MDEVISIVVDVMKIVRREERGAQLENAGPRGPAVRTHVAASLGSGCTSNKGERSGIHSIQCFNGAIFY